MPLRAKTPLGGALAAILLCAAGTSRAAEPSNVINGQVQLGDVFSTQTLNVEEATDGVSGAATTVGNIVSAVGNNAPIHIESDQSVSGRLESTISATVNGRSGPYLSTTASTTGNSMTGGTCCGLTDGSSLQAIEAGSVVSAGAVSRTGGPADSISVDANAVGNTTGWNQINGDVQTWTGQTNLGRTTATNTGTFYGTPGNAGFSATAVSNNVTADVENAPTDIGVGQEMRGLSTDATVAVQLGSGGDVQAQATGVGNNVDAQVQSPDGWTNVTQTNTAPVTASASADVATWTGDANVTAYGVGNSTLYSNAGPLTSMWSQQTNSGEVNSTAAFTGGTGSTVFASSTAMGNAVSGYACSTCGGVIGATNSQTNGARVRSTSSVTITGRAKSVAGESTAIGNSATYEVFGNGN